MLTTIDMINIESNRLLRSNHKGYAYLICFSRDSCYMNKTDLIRYCLRNVYSCYMRSFDHIEVDIRITIAIVPQNDILACFFLGVSLLSVDRLNLLRMAPGGHVGRFTIWTESAFKKLDSLFGTWSKKSQLKVDFK
jgi:hypothetical protein